METTVYPITIVQVDRIAGDLLVYMSDDTVFPVTPEQLLSLNIERTYFTLHSVPDDIDAIHLVRKAPAKRSAWWVPEKP